MRFALPVALLIFIVAALIFLSREPVVVPQVVSEKAPETVPENLPEAAPGIAQVDVGNAPKSVDQVSNKVDTGTRVCMTQPKLVEVSGAELGERIAGVAQFSIAAALKEYSQQQGVRADSLRTITLSFNVAQDQLSVPLEFNLAGTSVASADATAEISAAGSLRFPGHLFRNHSIITFVVRDKRGDLQDLSGYRNWSLCGEAFDDTQYDEREPVENDVTDLVPGPGVNVMGSEYACAQGWGLHHHLSAGVTHSELANMLSEWGVRTVRLPLNEHCWLAGRFAFDYLKPKFVGDAYKNSVEQLVELLTNQYQMHVVLDLHWTGTRQEQALELKPLPNHEFSAEFWSDVARRFAANRRVVFNLFNESHVPPPVAQPEQPADRPMGSKVDGTVLENPVPNHAAVENAAVDNTASDHADKSVAMLDLSSNSSIEKNAIAKNWWLIWRDGNDQYAGMQALVDAIRETGATNHISVGGLDYSADQRGWLSYVAHDPLGKMWVDNHAYPASGKCVEQACWDQTLLSLKANGFGVMFGETGNSIGQYPQGCEADFVKKVYRFAREHSIPALAWTFVAGGVSDSRSNQPTERNCQIPTLLTRWPGELADGDLSQNEVTQKKSFDPTPDNMLDDATWPGCVFYAYAKGLPLDNFNLPDRDPAVSEPGRRYGNCVAR